MPRPELEEAAEERIPLGRFGTTDEFANLAAFLMSDGSGYINGDVVTMDGGNGSKAQASSQRWDGN